MNSGKDSYIVISKYFNWSYQTYMCAINKYNYLKRRNIKCGLYKKLNSKTCILERIM